MSALSNAIESLFQFLAQNGCPPPKCDVLMAEIRPDTPLDERGRVRVRWSALHTPGAFEQRFEEILASGAPWINVTCYGLAREKLLIMVELPRVDAARAPRTSINFSGPVRAVLENDWAAEQAITIEE